MFYLYLILILVATAGHFFFQPDIAEPGKILNILIKSNQVLIDRVPRPTWKVDNVY